MPAVARTPLVSLRDVRFRWQPHGPDILVIDDFSVARGERVFVKGSSGAGKTTLLSLIGGIITAQHGTVTVMDSAINTLSGRQRDLFRADHIGFIFQMFNLIPYLSLLDNVILPCRFSGKRRQKALQRSADLHQEARRLLTQLELGVTALAGRPVSELSVGQQQRVAAARALIGSPELIIADEPTSALDADVRQVFLRLLFEEAEAAGATLLFVSHDGSLQAHFDRTLALTALNRS